MTLIRPISLKEWALTLYWTSWKKWHSLERVNIDNSFEIISVNESQYIRYKINIEALGWKILEYVCMLRTQCSKKKINNSRDKLWLKEQSPWECEKTERKLRTRPIGKDLTLDRSGHILPIVTEEKVLERFGEKKMNMFLNLGYQLRVCVLLSVSGSYTHACVVMGVKDYRWVTGRWGSILKVWIGKLVWGTWVVQSVKGTTLGFSSGSDLRVMSFSLELGSVLSAQRSVCLDFSLSLFPPPNTTVSLNRPNLLPLK